MRRNTVLQALNRLGSIQAKDNCPIKTCPRCGELMRMPATTNALSRRAGCYICPDCGTAEALEDYLTVGALPVERWAFVVDVLNVLNGKQDE